MKLARNNYRPYSNPMVVKATPIMYCNQCAIRLNHPIGDFAGYMSKLYWERTRLGAKVICDSCGPCEIDPDGNKVEHASNSVKDN